MTTTNSAPRSRGTAIGLGVLIALAGVILLVWPAATTLVLMSWLGLAIVCYGVYELVNAVTGAGEGSRLWGAVIGVVAVIGGIGIFFAPLVSAVAVGVVIGWYWIIGGAVGIAAAILQPGNRLVRLLVAILSVIAGVVVLAQPGLSLVTLVWFAGAWMLAAGVIMAGSALLGRRETRPATT